MAKNLIHAKYGPALDIEALEVGGVEFHRYAYGDERFIRISADHRIMVSDLALRNGRLYFVRLDGKSIDGALPCRRREKLIEACEAGVAAMKAADKAAAKAKQLANLQAANARRKAQAAARKVDAFLAQAA